MKPEANKLTKPQRAIPIFFAASRLQRAVNAFQRESRDNKFLRNELQFSLEQLFRSLLPRAAQEVVGELVDTCAAEAERLRHESFVTRDDAAS